MPLFAHASHRSARVPVGMVKTTPVHALQWSDGFPIGTTEREFVDRALEAPAFCGDFVRDGDLKRVDIVAGSRGPLTAESKLGAHAFGIPPFTSRSTRSVLAASGVTSRLLSVVGTRGAASSFTSALEDQGMHP